MCGRYYIPPEDDDAGFQVILDQLRAGYRESPLLPSMKRGEIFPSDIVPAVTRGAPALMKWGFARYDGKGLVINARLETASEKPMFKGAFYHSRCLLPAECYFEWRKDGAAKQKYAIGDRFAALPGGPFQVGAGLAAAPFRHSYPSRRTRHRVHPRPYARHRTGAAPGELAQ